MADILGCGPQRIVIAGGSGFLGLSLASHLAARGKEIVLLSRRPPQLSGPWRHAAWDARTLGEWRRELDGACGLVNLAGRSVDCVKAPDHQDEILRSRVESTCVLGAALRSIVSPPPVWVQMSTAHIYGDPPEVVCTEASPFGYGLAPFVGRAWEDAFFCERASVAARGYSAYELCFRSRPGRGWRRAFPPRQIGKNGSRRHDRFGDTGDELDPRTRPQSSVRASP